MARNMLNSVKLGAKAPGIKVGAEAGAVLMPFLCVKNQEIKELGSGGVSCLGSRR